MAENNLVAQLVNALSGGTRQPVVTRLGTIKGMDSYSDTTTLADGMVQYIQNMRLLKGVTYTREGWVKYNTTSMEYMDDAGVLRGNVQGLGEYLPDLNTPFVMAVCGGKVWQGDDGVMTEVYDGLSRTTLCQLIQTQNIMLVSDGVHGVVVYEDGRIPYAIGIPSPKAEKVVATFQAGEEWVVSGGTQTPDEGWYLHGTQSIVFTSDMGGWCAFAHTFPDTPIDLTHFPDTTLSDEDDNVMVSFIRGDPAHITACVLQLASDVNFTNYYQFDMVSGGYPWDTSTLSYVYFNQMCTKAFFTAIGTPDWGSIVGVRIIFTTDKVSPITMQMDRITFVRTALIAHAVGDSPNGVLNGQYYYRMTFVNSNDEESEGSEVSNLATPEQDNVILDHLPVSGSPLIVRRRLYRAGATLSDFTLVYEFDDNVQRTFIDKVAEGELIDAPVLDDINGQPYFCKAVCIHGNYTILANLTSPYDGTTYPDGIQVSQEHSYNVYDVLKLFELEARSGTQAMWLHSEFGLVYTGKEDSIWSFDPSNLNQPPRCESRLYGGVGVNGVVSGENCFYYLDRLAVVQCNGSSHVEISNPYVRNYIESIPDDLLWKSWLRYFDHTLYVGVPYIVEGEEITLILVYYAPTNSWVGVIKGWDSIAPLVTNTPAFGKHLYLGGVSGGYVYDTFQGDNDDGKAVESVVWLKDDHFGEPETFKDYTKLYILGSKVMEDDVELVITPYFNRVDSGVVIDGEVTTLTSTSHTLLELPMPPVGGEGNYLGVKISAVGRWLMRSITQVVRMRENTY